VNKPGALMSAMFFSLALAFKARRLIKVVDNSNFRAMGSDKFHEKLPERSR